MKALASRSTSDSKSPPLNSSLGLSSDSSSSPPESSRSASTSNPQKLSAALTNLQLNSYLERPASTARLFLQSPCFFHKRFDDAVNIQKVLEEIADDEWLSHSRLVQTATGVREVSKQLQRRPVKRAVKTVMIVTKARDNSLVHLTRELAEWLLSTPRYGSEAGINVYVDAKLRKSKRFDAPGLLQKDARFADMLHYWTPDLCWTSPEKFDLVLTLGGDGTVLFTSWLFQRVVPPVLCFSLGSLGFLTNFEFENYKSHLNAVMGDVGMRVNLRMRFTCTVFRKDRTKGAEADAVEEGEQFEVLNELVIDRGPSPYVSNLELYADNDLLTVVQADGCIFSTPTGMFTDLLSDPLANLEQGLPHTPSPLAALSFTLPFLASFLLPSALTRSPSAPWSYLTRSSSASRSLSPPGPLHTARLTAKAVWNSVKGTMSPLKPASIPSPRWSPAAASGSRASSAHYDGTPAASSKKAGAAKALTKRPGKKNGTLIPTLVSPVLTAGSGPVKTGMPPPTARCDAR